jgi:uncharacterized protein (DUF305 family)
VRAWTNQRGAARTGSPPLPSAAMNHHLLRRIRPAVVLIVFVAGLSGCGTRTDHAVPHTGITGATGATQQAIVPPTPSAATGFDAADVSFVQMMIPHHQQALEMAALAPVRAKDPRVKALARQIAVAQRPEIATMTGLLKTWGKPASAPGGMKMDADSMPGLMSDTAMNQLSAVSGDDFDRQFLTMMVAHHGGAVVMAKEERANGRNTRAEELAQSIVTGQQAQIATMEKLLAQL